MFEYLAKFKKILVTGPQRSGTTIIARAISYDLDIDYVDEQAFEATNHIVWQEVMSRQASFVVQAPGMCRWAHELPAEIAVVLCRRDLADIVASQERIGWEHEVFELARYGLDAGQDGSTIAVVKYEFWDCCQKFTIQNAFEVQYESLAEHPLWVRRGLRAGFNRRQYRLDYA